MSQVTKLRLSCYQTAVSWPDPYKSEAGKLNWGVGWKLCKYLADLSRCKESCSIKIYFLPCHRLQGSYEENDVTEIAKTIVRCVQNICKGGRWGSNFTLLHFIEVFKGRWIYLRKSCKHHHMAILQTFVIVIPPTTKLGGVYWIHPVCLSVCLSVTLSCPPCSIYSSGWILSMFGTNDQ